MFDCEVVNKNEVFVIYVLCDQSVYTKRPKRSKKRYGQVCILGEEILNIFCSHLNNFFVNLLKPCDAKTVSPDDTVFFSFLIKPKIFGQIL